MKHHMGASSADLYAERLHTILDDGEFVLYRQRDPTDTQSLLVVKPIAIEELDAVLLRASATSASGELHADN